MASKKNRARASKDTTQRKYKKKTSALITEKVEYVDYKDIDLLSRFMSDRAKIRNRRVSGNDVQQQREVAGAIKIAREMALLPYARRVATQRTRPPRDGRPGRDRDAEATGETPDLTEPVDQDAVEAEVAATVETVAPGGETATETEGEDLR
jgi:small subunit ribosomal protein S18